MHQVHRVRQIRKPLDNEADPDDFKVTHADVGLLCAQKNVRPNEIFYVKKELEEFKKGLAENFVFCQLWTAGFKAFTGEMTKERRTSILSLHWGTA